MAKELFNNRTFTLVWLAQAASGLGHTFAAFILSWLVYELTGSKVAMGSIWLCYMLPNLAVQLLAGPFLDRWQRRKVMIFAEWQRALIYLLPAVLFTQGRLEVWHLYLVAALSGIAEPLFRSASMAYIPDILPPHQLMRGNSVLEGTAQVFMLSGPALGGLMVANLGVLAVLLGLIAVLGLAGLLLCLIPASPKRTASRSEKWLSQFREGLKFFRFYPVLFWVGMMLLAVNFCSGAAHPMYLPLVVEELGGNAFQYGLFSSFFSVGMLLGSVWAGAVGEPKNRRLVMLGSLFLSGLLQASLGWTQSYTLALAAVAGLGFTAMLFTINNTTFYQKRVPERLRGRVFAVRILMSQMGMPLGSFLGGVMGEALGLKILFTFLGGLILLVTSAAFLSPIFNRLNDNTILEEEIYSPGL